MSELKYKVGDLVRVTKAKTHTACQWRPVMDKYDGKLYVISNIKTDSLRYNLEGVVDDYDKWNFVGEWLTKVDYSDLHGYRQCTECKHVKLNIDEEPCSRCFEGGSTHFVHLWEPKTEKSEDKEERENMKIEKIVLRNEEVEKHEFKLGRWYRYVEDGSGTSYFKYVDDGNSGYARTHVYVDDNNKAEITNRNFAEVGHCKSYIKNGDWELLVEDFEIEIPKKIL